MTDGTVRVFELAKDHRISSHAMLKILTDLGFDPKSHMSIATLEMVKAVNQKFAQEKQEAKREMEHRAQVTESIAKKRQQTEEQAPEQEAAPTPEAAAEGRIKETIKKPKKKERRKKKEKKVTDPDEVAK